MAPTKTPNALRGTIRGVSSNNVVNFSIRAVPLPRIIVDFLLDNILALKKLQQEKKAKETNKSVEHARELEDDVGLLHNGVDTQGDLHVKHSVQPEQFWNVLREKFAEAGPEWDGQVDRIWTFGPHSAGGCVLIDARKDIIPNSYVSISKYLTLASIPTN